MVANAFKQMILLCRTLGKPLVSIRYSLLNNFELDLIENAR